MGIGEAWEVSTSPACLAGQSGANASGSYWWQPPGVSPVPLSFLETWPEDWFWGGAKTGNELGEGKQAGEQTHLAQPADRALIYRRFSTFLRLLPLNTVPHDMVTPNYIIIYLLLHK